MRSIHFLIAAASALGVRALPQSGADQLVERQASSKLVFCHFMIGVVSDRTSAADFDDDMQRAKALGIDAFALNIGTDSYTDQQLGFAYQSAANNGMKVFISFDFNWYNTGQGSAVGAKIAQYAGLPAQLFVNGKVFASSFAGDGLDVSALRAAAGRDVYFAPNYHPGQGDFSTIDGALNWVGWESNGNNKAPSGGVTVTVNAGDQSYLSTLGGKGYIAPASPWFSTHFGPEVSYSKNWVFPGDLLWYMRWVEILALQPTFVEIVTWTPYGESHYIGPLSSPHTDNGGSKWVNDMPHGGWLDMAKPFIAAYKAGATSIVYCIAPKALNCDATDTTLQPANNASGNYFEGRPNGFDSMTDNVFSFTLNRNGAQVMSATSLKLIQNVCPCGLYNFNAYVGTVPASAPDALKPDGLAAFANGLKVAWAATPPAVTPATTTIVATAAPTSPPV
ncbi:putative alpha-1,3-glucanase/mutanase [Mycena latifolia]|nr:putative alpha-1,3-glucanase/mutanase [Mycena latifolia]